MSFSRVGAQPKIVDTHYVGAGYMPIMRKIRMGWTIYMLMDRINVSED